MDWLMFVSLHHYWDTDKLGDILIILIIAPLQPHNTTERSTNGPGGPDKKRGKFPTWRQRIIQELPSNYANEKQFGNCH